ncbi:type I-E CRISPR-associated endonuclease Cas1e [uncultured Tessaracoccus sp.]|uniref:type I-E CRISPR-associated endonuclease Cas1e n=1 Tax=uncultured Tessaracoccus sp. TaxID=905023 RepID=UPI0025D74CB1|nr:type I-E CRISPR-associated endonuclease Cas1e [uncultured Tessaracoccus sp.]
MEDRITFLHLERCTVSRSDNSITATSQYGSVHVPAAAISTVLLGPGTKITHHAMMLLATCGVSVVWVGEEGVRYYAHGTPLARSTRLLEAQAEAVSNRRSRLRVARMMYEQRFPDEAVSHLTMQQLRGREGARVRAQYRHHSDRTGVEWRRREYDPKAFADSDPINQALSAAHSCLYGVVHAIIVSLGCAPGLGFVHTGHARAFVYDMADLYKSRLTIPIAFDVVAEDAADISGETRRRVRDAMRSSTIMERCVKDLKRLLLPSDEPDLDVEVLRLWDEARGTVAAGHNHAEVSDW